MTSLYTWLKFIHLLSVGGFLFVHGVAGGVAFLLRGPVTGTTRGLLRASMISSQASYPFILLILITGIWMALAGHWANKIWPWAALAVLIATLVVMGLVARPYFMARGASSGPDDALSARLAATRPMLAAATGVVALLILFWLMVFKPL